MDGLLGAARERLGEAPFKPPRREAALLLARVWERSEAWLMARGEHPVPDPVRHRFEALLTRRLGGEPFAYLLGEREFYGRSFAVDPRVLIPRPETEHLVEAVLALPLPSAPRLLDVGTGSGCLAITLALELPAAKVVATDLAPGALAVAAANARRLGAAERVRFLAADLVAGLELGAFDAMVSNPPYVAPEDAERLSIEVRGFEPPLALFAQEQGLAVYRRLLAGASCLGPGSSLLLELGLGQAEPVLGAAHDAGFELTRLISDYAGIPRTMVLEKSARGPAAGPGKGA